MATNPTLRSEAERLLPMLERRCAPVDQPVLLVKLIEQAVTFGVQAKNDAEWASVLGIYLDVLGKLPEEAVTEAFDRWNRGELYPKDPGRHAFFPKPAEIYSLAEPRMLELKMAAYRARKALAHVESVEAKERNPEDIARIREMLSDFKSKAMPEASRPFASRHEMAERMRAAAEIQTGKSGLSPAMRKHMGLEPEPIDTGADSFMM